MVTGCENGTFGNNCISNCSGHCLHDHPCNQETGHCDEGCQPGYNDTFCSKRWCTTSLNMIDDLNTVF